MFLFVLTFSGCSSRSQTRFNSDDLHPKPAEFIGGLDSLRSYIISNLNYPATAKRDSVEGKVIIQFYIETNGEIQNVTVLKGIRSDVDEEAVRIVKAMPKWIGTTVRVKYKLPINFFIEK